MPNDSLTPPAAATTSTAILTSHTPQVHELARQIYLRTVSLLPTVQLTHSEFQQAKAAAYEAATTFYEN